ncbi:MAG TPA: NAD-dependent epimerase/dehydratase family protein [Casimicrobiaceae bacterium]|nr:NAD-dependent epimerase/dehydratase family protein [Casimicrobiaceae bacterium]
MIDGPVVVTGASGFIGGAVCRFLAERGQDVQAWVRTSGPGYEHDPRIHVVGDLSGVPEEELEQRLSGARAVVHLAARVHVLRERAPDALDAFRVSNVLTTARLAQAAARAGVPRFIFASSVKVLGDHTDPQRAFRDGDEPAPRDPYAQSKLEAEQALAAVARETSLAIAILRPPLVYGPGVGGNFLRLWRAIARGVPLPLARVNNRRSLVYVGNVVHAITKLIDAAEPLRGSWLVADREALSTPELARHIAAALGVRARLIPLPSSWMAGAARLTGRQAVWTSLAGSLVVDAEALNARVGPPPFTLVQGLAATAKWWMEPAR